MNSTAASAQDKKKDTTGPASAQNEEKETDPAFAENEAKDTDDVQVRFFLFFQFEILFDTRQKLTFILFFCIFFRPSQLEVIQSQMLITTLKYSEIYLEQNLSMFRY